jgi:2'-5' RNA ligase
MNLKDNVPFQGRSEFELRRNAFLDQGKEALLKDGAIEDAILRAELGGATRDLRYGLNIICRPTEELRKAVVEIQEQMRRAEPDQYCYPEADLHLTLLEICHSCSREELSVIVNKVGGVIPLLFRSVDSIHLDSPEVIYDAHACALAFLPSDNNLQRCRAALVEILDNSGIPLRSRYLANSAHVTLMRYVAPLRSSRKDWVNILSNVMFNRNLVWDIREAWITWGTNWYGMQSCISERGPFVFRK